jgi:hypothetical protein
LLLLLRQLVMAPLIRPRERCRAVVVCIQVSPLVAKTSTAADHARAAASSILEETANAAQAAIL